MHVHISHFLIQIAVLIIFVISAYKAISSVSTRTLLDFLFNASVAIWLLHIYLINGSISLIHVFQYSNRCSSILL